MRLRDGYQIQRSLLHGGIVTFIQYIMKHTPRRPEVNVNISIESSYSSFWQFSCILITLLVSGYFLVGFLLDLTIPMISLKRERALFGTTMPSFLGTPLAEHPDKTLLETLARRFASLAEERDFDFAPTIIDTSFPNAFALPGGTVVFTDELLKKLDSDEAKAFVLAHEIGHVIRRHAPRRIAGTVLFGLLSGIVFGDGSALSSVTNSAFGLNDLRHSRTAESEADITALDLIERVYGRVDGAFEAFKVLQSISDSSGGGSIEMLQTHPLTKRRNAELRRIAINRGYQFTDGSDSPSKHGE